MKCSESFYYNVFCDVFHLFNYHPQTKFSKVMFLQVSICPGGFASVHAGIANPPPGRPPREQTPWEQTPAAADRPPMEQIHPPPLPSACWETRPTSGRYASYWNAYLFMSIFRIWDSEVCRSIDQNIQLHVKRLCTDLSKRKISHGIFPSSSKLC